jgi:hypothetical protein
MNAIKSYVSSKNHNKDKEVKPSTIENSSQYCDSHILHDYYCDNDRINSNFINTGKIDNLSGNSSTI